MKSNGGDKLDTSLGETLRPAGKLQKRKKSASAESKKKIPVSSSQTSQPETRKHPAQDPCPLDLEDDSDYPPMLHRYKRQKFKDLNLLLTEPAPNLAKTLGVKIEKYYQRRKRTNTETSSVPSGSEGPEQTSLNNQARGLEKEVEPKAIKLAKVVKSESVADGNVVEENSGVPKLELLHQCEDPANCQSACVARELLPRLDHLTDEELIFWFKQVTGEMFVRRPGEKVRGRIRRVIRAEAKKIGSAASSDQAKCVSSDVVAPLPMLESSPSSLRGGIIKEDDSAGQLLQETSLSQEEACSEKNGTSAQSSSSVVLAASKDCGVSSEEGGEDEGRGFGSVPGCDDLQSAVGQKDAQVAKPVCWMVVKREIAETAKEELQTPLKAQTVAYSVEEHSEPSPNAATERQGLQQEQECDDDGLVSSQGSPSSHLHGERCQTAEDGMEVSVEVTSNARQLAICRLNCQFQEDAASNCSQRTTPNAPSGGLPETNEEEPKAAAASLRTLDAISPEAPTPTTQRLEMEVEIEPELEMNVDTKLELQLEAELMPTAQKPEKMPTIVEPEPEWKPETVPETQESAQEPEPEASPTPSMEELEPERQAEPMTTHQEPELETEMKPEPATRIQESEVEREPEPTPAIQEKEQLIGLEPMPRLQEKEQLKGLEPMPRIQESELEKELDSMPTIEEKEQEIEPEPTLKSLQESDLERDLDSTLPIQEEQDMEPKPTLKILHESQLQMDLDPTLPLQEPEQAMEHDSVPKILQESQLQMDLDPTLPLQEPEQAMEHGSVPKILQESQLQMDLDPTLPLQEPEQAMEHDSVPKIQEPELEIEIETMPGFQVPEVILKPESASIEESEPELKCGSEQHPLAFQFHSPDPYEKMKARLSERISFGDSELNGQSESFRIPKRFNVGDTVGYGQAGSSIAQSPETSATTLQASSINDELRQEGEEKSDCDHAVRSTENEESDFERVKDGDLPPTCQVRTTSVEMHENDASCCLSVTGVTTISCPAESEKSGSVPGLESPSVSSAEFCDAREDFTDASENSHEMMMAAREDFTDASENSYEMMIVSQGNSTDASENSHDTMMVEVEVVNSQRVVSAEVMDEDGLCLAGVAAVAKVVGEDDQRELGGRWQMEGSAAFPEDGSEVQDASSPPWGEEERLREFGQMALGSCSDNAADVISESPGELIFSGGNAGNSESTAVCASVAPAPELLKRGLHESVEEDTQRGPSENKLGVMGKNGADEANGQSLSILSKGGIMVDRNEEVLECARMALEEAGEGEAGPGASEMDGKCSSVVHFGKEMPKLMQEGEDRPPECRLEENELQGRTEQPSNTSVQDADDSRHCEPCLEALRSDIEVGPNAESVIETSGACHPEWIAEQALSPLERPSDTAMEDVSTSGDAQGCRIVEINEGMVSPESQQKGDELGQAFGSNLKTAGKSDSGCGADSSLALLEQAETSSEHLEEDLPISNPEVNISVPQASSRLETQDSASAQIQDLESLAIAREMPVAQYRLESIVRVEEPCCTSGGTTWETRKSSSLMAREQISESFASQLSLDHPESESQVVTAAERAKEEEGENNLCSNGDSSNDSFPSPPERKESFEDESQGSRNEKGVLCDEEEMVKIDSDDIKHQTHQIQDVEVICHLRRGSDEAPVQESQQKPPSEVAGAEEGEEDREEVAEELDCSRELSLPSSQDSVMIAGVEILYSSSTPWDDLLRSESQSHDNGGFSVEAQDLVELGSPQPVVVACIDEEGIKLDRILQSFDFDVHDEWLDAGGKHPEAAAAAESAITASTLEKEQVDEDMEHGSPKKRKLCDGSQSQVQVQSPERLAARFGADVSLEYGTQHKTPSSPKTAEDELNGAQRSLKSSLAVAKEIAGGSTGSERSPSTTGAPARRKLRSKAKQRHAAATVSRCQRLQARNERKSQIFSPRARTLKGVMTALREKTGQSNSNCNGDSKLENSLLTSWKGQDSATAAPAEVLECSESYSQMEMEVLESDSYSNLSSGFQQGRAVGPGALIPEYSPLNCLQSEDTRMASSPPTSQSVDQFDEHGHLQHLMPHLEPPSKLLRARKTISPTSRRELLRASSSGIYPLHGDSPPQKTSSIGGIQTPRSGISFDKVPRSGGRRLFSTPSLPTTSTPSAAQDEPPPLQFRISTPVDKRARHPKSSSPPSSFGILHANGILSSPRSPKLPRKISLSLSPLSVMVQLPQPSCPMAPPPQPSGAPAPALSLSPAPGQAPIPAPAQAPAQVQYKGILKSSPKSCMGLCKCPKCAEARFREGQGAAEFIAVQMKAFMNISRQLTKEVQSLRAMVETRATNAEDLNEVEESLQKSRDAELSIDKNIVRLVRDSRRMCKLINAKPSARKIIFADEAGQALCQIKTFQA